VTRLYYRPSRESSVRLRAVRLRAHNRRARSGETSPKLAAGRDYVISRTRAAAAAACSSSIDRPMPAT
jgi:hypothetical protein